MFTLLGLLATRHRWLIVVGWVALALILPLTAPSLEEVGTSDQRDFLPADAPFAQAEAAYQAAFPENFTPSSGIMLIDTGVGGGLHSTVATQFITEATTWLTSEAAPDNILDVGSPQSDPALAERLVDESERYGLIVFGLSTSDVDKRTIDSVETIDEWVADHTPRELTVYHTGQAKLNIEGDEVMLETIDRTLIITVVLVIVFLLLIYRSPVSPLIPLFTVTIALFVSVGILGFLGDVGIVTIITQTNALLIVVMYGAGTDYCLFLINRFREEMAATNDTGLATKDTVRLVGETITSSAGTIFVGFMAMAFSEMGFFANSGPMLAIGIVTVLLAGLTLTPALLALLGERAFWPAKAKHRSSGRWYEFTSRQASSHPLITILLIVGIMVPFSVYGLSRPVMYDIMGEYPETMESVKGYKLLEAHFGQGLLFPLTVVLTERDPQTMAAEIAQLSDELAQIKGVSDVMSLNMPLGLDNTDYQQVLRIDTQLQMALGMVLNSTDRAEQEPLIGAWVEFLKQLPLDTTALQGELAADTLNPETVTAETMALVEQVGGLENPYRLPLFGALQALEANYIAASGEAYQLTVLLSQDPGHDNSAEAIAAMRTVLAKYEDDGFAGVSGFAAVITDIRDTLDRDLVRAFGFVLVGIFIVLLLMLRSAVAPLYLIATVVLSYTFTLGMTNIVFDVFFGVERLSWAVEFFMFVFLVALGIDYSIFLFGRIKEEVGYHGVREGVHTAVASTGAIITSAGLILAGTFGGLMVGEIRLLAQVGFAVAFGVLVDTFVVRTILDPALAALFGRWTWWPGGVPKARRVKALAAGD